MILFIAITMTFIMYVIILLAFKDTFIIHQLATSKPIYKIMLILSTIIVIYIILRILFFIDTNKNEVFCIGYNNIVFARYLTSVICISVFFTCFFLVILGFHTNKLPGSVLVHKNKKSSLAVVFNRFVSLILLSLSVLSFVLPLVIGITMYNNQLVIYRDILKKNQYHIIEGEVQVVSFGGKFKGENKSDIIQIGDKVFTITPDWSPAYNITVIKGGLLNNGVKVKVYYYDNTILKISLVLNEYVQWLFMC
ncbi:MAG: hypothetical protein Q4G68_09890 [Planctomycetia bacterium]|nr:hypothetical protein [Planctomycetia bacterium]